MGLFFLQAFNDLKHKQVKELAKAFELPIEAVEKHYEKMIEELENEKKSI